MNALISVVVPVYNAEKYLDKCIQSIINQKYRNLEIILVDDGSKDNSLEICKKYAEKDKRIKVINKENGGVSTARNIGIEVANGDFMAFVDSDDYIDENMYFNMMQKSNEHECDVIMCDCYKVISDEKYVFTHDIRGGFYDKEQLYKEYFDKLLMQDSINYPPTISNWVMLIKANIIKTNKLKYKEGIKFSEDLLFGSKAMYYANSFYYLKNECYYNYINNPTSTTNTYYEKKWDNFTSLYVEIRLFFEDKKDFDFSMQIYNCLLFFIYNSIGNIYSSNKKLSVKKKDILKILNTKEVREMFNNIDIKSLNLSKKQQLITYCYKNKVFISALILYMSRK
ncbi:glycosyltransferase family 2 protein [Terrisporobacter mayombei]|uniref:Glycosyltransferase EpsJ n=1 Tax=Terrisporobacter mayombei TaxID=1541 RepID=A0ABY9Q5Y8_9FIRM|nr:glycosyltransferase [Terrisporobacter mayombei]MCC3869656.1 glycosyltransferase [Terrisporobacter mayombei]WMT83406.1 putative glycosyltransferase EpsJ [Terrisporobacter mayombei]